MPNLADILRAGWRRAARALGFGGAVAAASTRALPAAPRPAVTTHRPGGRGGQGERDDVIREPSGRNWIDWDADGIMAAEQLAASGNLRQAAELCHALLADERIASNLATLTRGLLGLPLSWEAGAGRQKHRAVRALEAEEDWLSMADEATLAQLLLWGVLLGVAVAKLTPYVGASGRLLLKVEPWDPRWLRWDDAGQRWMITTANAGEVPVETDGRWLVLTPHGAHRPWEHGIYRILARWWLLKRYAREDWMRHSEVKAQGVLVAFSTDAARQGPAGRDDLSARQRKHLAEQLKGLGRDAALVLPRGLDMKLVESQAKNYETFEKQIELSNTGISVGILGQNLTTEVKGGSFAAAKVHADVADYLRRAYAEILATTLHFQLLAFWALWNFRAEAIAPWPAWRVEAAADAKALGEAMKALAEGIEAAERTVPEGYAVDREALYQKAGVPLRALPKPAPTRPQTEREAA
jgi:phage gp29-like protein